MKTIKSGPDEDSPNTNYHWNRKQTLYNMNRHMMVLFKLKI